MLVVRSKVLQPRRRYFLLATVAMMGCWGLPAWAQEAAQALMTEFLAGQSPQTTGIMIELPDVADNATSVPLAIAVESVAQEGVFCEELLVIATKNPLPTVCRFRFTPLMGAAKVETRIRLAESQSVMVLARLSDGSIRHAEQEITVTMGGCG